MQLETRIELPVIVEYKARLALPSISSEEPHEIEIVSVMFNGHPVELDAEQQDALEQECLLDASIGPKDWPHPIN